VRVTFAAGGRATGRPVFVEVAVTAPLIEPPTGGITTLCVVELGVGGGERGMSMLAITGKFSSSPPTCLRTMSAPVGAA
jgi:hypothetical protein